MRADARAGFGLEVKRRIMLGTYVLSAGYYDAYYLKAQQVRTLILRDYDRAFERVDVVAMPTSPTAAFRIGERVADPLQMYLADVFTVSANLAGLPAISVPCGFTADRLPIGLQLTGRRFDEATLLRAVDAYERETPWHRGAAGEKGGGVGPRRRGARGRGGRDDKADGRQDKHEGQQDDRAEHLQEGTQEHEREPEHSEHENERQADGQEKQPEHADLLPITYVRPPRGVQVNGADRPDRAVRSGDRYSIGWCEIVSSKLLITIALVLPAVFFSLVKPMTTQKPMNSTNTNTVLDARP